MPVIATKLIRWFVFGVLVALVPIVVSYLDLVVKSQAVKFDNLIGDGGLLLIISAICAGAIGELIGSGRSALFFKIVSTGVTVIILLISSFMFASIFEGRANLSVDVHAVADLSFWIFIIGMISCAGCIALSEL